MELKDKTILITGSTDGLGKLLAKHFAQYGAFVLLHGRNKDKGKLTVEEIYKETKSSRLAYYNADFNSLQNVKSLGDEILKEHKQIDILINNAGIGKGKHKEMSKDGIEMHFAVNYLSHVLLTETLLPALVEGSKIINVASVGQAPLDFSDLMLDHGYDGFLAYKKSKSALIMYTIDLAERLKSAGIKVNAIHPASLMHTKMVIEDWGKARSTVEEGAKAVETLLGSTDTGEYFDQAKIAKAIPQTYNEKARLKLKEVTAQLLERFSPVMV